MKYLILVLFLTSCVVTDKEYEKEINAINNMHGQEIASMQDRTRFIEKQLFRANEHINWLEEDLQQCKQESTLTAIKYDSILKFYNTIILEETLSENDSIIVKNIIFRKSN